MPAAPTRTIAQIVRANVFTRFNALLGAMLALILLVGGPYQDALFGVVLVANALIGIVQEIRAKRTLDRLTLLTAPRAHVVRDGAVREVPVGEVVLDDVLDAPAGAQIVVDGEVVARRRARGGRVAPHGRVGPGAQAAGRSGALRRRSSRRGRVGTGRRRVGADAYAARIAQDARRFTLTDSELRDGIDRILLYVTWAIVPTAVLLFVSQYRVARLVARRASPGAVAGTVAMVPEGLVLLTSLAFAVAVVRLARQRVLVQELPAVEGLARVDVLCIDKTGTLTEGRLGDRARRPARRDRPRVRRWPRWRPPIRRRTRRCGRSPRPTHRRPDGWRPDGGVPFSSARKWSAAIVRRQRDVGPRRARRARRSPASSATASAPRPRPATACCCSRGPRSIRGDALPEDREPVAAIVLADRVRGDAAATLAYFAEQGVAVKVLSGDHPATVGAIAASLGLEGAERPVDATQLPDDAAGARCVARVALACSGACPRSRSARWWGRSERAVTSSR